MTAAAPARLGWRRILVVAGVALAVFCLVAFAAAVMLMPRAAAANRRVQCANNLKNIGGLLLAGVDTDEARLARRGDELVFFCPQALVNDWEGARAAATSYLVRDGKRDRVPPDRPSRRPLAVCVHHADGVIVFHDDASTDFLGRSELGLGPDDPIETGPQSKSALLRLFPPRPAR